MGNKIFCQQNNFQERNKKTDKMRTFKKMRQNVRKEERSKANMRNREIERRKTKCSTKWSGPEEQGRIKEDRKELQ